MLSNIRHSWLSLLMSAVETWGSLRQLIFVSSDLQVLIWGFWNQVSMLYPRKTSIQAAYLNQHSDIGWVYSYAQFVNEQGAFRKR